MIRLHPYTVPQFPQWKASRGKLCDGSCSAGRTPEQHFGGLLSARSPGQVPSITHPSQTHPATLHFALPKTLLAPDSLEITPYSAIWGSGKERWHLPGHSTPWTPHGGGPGSRLTPLGRSPARAAPPRPAAGTVPVPITLPCRGCERSRCRAAAPAAPCETSWWS